MASIQPLTKQFAITNNDGTPTEYFIRWAQQRQIDISGGITQQMMIDYLNTISVTAGDGLSGGGPLTPPGPTIDLDAGLGDLNDVDFSTPPANNQVIVFDSATNTWKPANQSGGGGGGTPPTIRGSNIQSSSASSYTVPFPAGSAVGDLAILFCGHGFAVNRPAAWVQLHATSTSNWNGAVFTKTLVPTDISTGSVTITTTGSFNGVFSMVTLVGSTATCLTSPVFAISETSASAINSRGVPALGTPASVALFFSSARLTFNPTWDIGTQLQAINATNSSGAVYYFIPQTGNSPINTAQLGGANNIYVAAVSVGGF